MECFLEWSMGAFVKTEIDMKNDMDLISRLSEFIETEARSCSMIHVRCFSRIRELLEQ